MRTEPSVVTATTIRVELVDSQWGDRKLYRFLALRNDKILDIVELDPQDWRFHHALSYIRKDRWLAANRARLDITEVVANYADVKYCQERETV